jgi:hypothetical protein
MLSAHIRLTRWSGYGVRQSEPVRDEELLLRNQYLVTENRILRRQVQGRLQLTDYGRVAAHVRFGGAGRQGQHQRKNDDPGDRRAHGFSNGFSHT